MVLATCREWGGCDISPSPADAVPKPTINFVVDESNPESCRVTVNCSVGLTDVTYEWLPPKRIASNNGSELLLTFSPLMEVYTCVAKNPVSSNSSRLIHRHPCSWEGIEWDGWERALAQGVPSSSDMGSL